MRTRWLVTAGEVLAAWIVLLALENIAVGLGYRNLFAGSWELAAARTRVSPIALAALVPASLLASFVAAAVARAEMAPGARRGIAWAAAVLGAALAYGVSFGRHMASWGVRAPFVTCIAAAAAGLAWALAPRIATLARTRPLSLAVVGAGAAAGLWCADAFVLPRLYPAFHAALAMGVLASGALVSLAWRSAAGVGLGALVLGVACVPYAPFAATRLRTADNLRIILLEHAPLLGRAVRLAAWISPPPPDDGPELVDAPIVGPPRALDWTGHDVLLVSIDALRADHVSAYGYPRPTTPNLDRLAGEGALFEGAYCPTPHTSYSVTSMMTGKYMRPLLAMGAGVDSETWASYARRYGYRTAAFYPPAVFFIDEAKFTTFRDRGLDFEYRKVEFAAPQLRVGQLADYLAREPAGDKPLFVWVHLFEPHEPYVMHDEHRFGSKDAFTDVDAYDSEIAAADEGLGALVTEMKKARPGAVVIVTADHGEEFADHGGRYHGTTVYEEQVRVPLVIVGPGVTAQRVRTPVQTIDLLPTTLSALGVPRPSRVRGRDLGPILAGKAKDDAGMAFAGSDDYTLLAKGSDRLICARKAAACALYDVARDPLETKDLSATRVDVAREMRRATHAIEKENGRFESGEGSDLPEALRRGVQGDVDAAPDVAALLDDAKLAVRRRAAEVLFALHTKDTVPQLRRAALRDEDADVRRFAELALVRIGEKPGALAEALVKDADVAWRRRAALAFAEQGDARGQGELVAWWTDKMAGLEFDQARELLAALARVNAKNAAPVLARSLSDVRLRPDVADALGALGDPRAKEPLLQAFASERYVSARPHEARALVRLGARGELEAPLVRFAGLPQPMRDAVEIAAGVGLLVPARGGWSGGDRAGGKPDAGAAATVLDVSVRVPKGPARLLVLAGAEGNTGTRATIDGEAVSFERDGRLRFADVAPRAASAALHVEDASGVVAMWLVPRAEEIPPPPPERWDGGADAELR